MVPLRTSALNNCLGKMWQGQRFRGGEAAESIFYEVSAALTCHRRAHSQEPLVRQERAFAPAVPLQGFFSWEKKKPPFGFSKLIPHNSSTEEQNAPKYTSSALKACSRSQRERFTAPLPPKAVADGNVFAFHKRCSVCSPRLARVYGDSTQTLHPSSSGLFLARKGTDAARQ